MRSELRAKSTFAEIPPPLPVPCAGCGEPTAYRPGEDTGTYGEWLLGPLGRVYSKTHRRRSCVEQARARLGKPRAFPKTDHDRMKEGLRR